MDIFERDLNKSQFEAVKYTDGPELIIAGAGAGKTRVLTYKIAYLLTVGYRPWEILALTFTNKAAREMKERVGNLVGSDVARYLNMGTFHSIFLRILRAEAEHVGLQKNFSVYDETDSRSVINSIVKELQLDDKIYKANIILSRIGAAKNSLITPDVYMSDGNLLERDKRTNVPKIGLIYNMYIQRCRNANAIDFDDMLMLTYQLFSKSKDLCTKYSDHYKYMLVDEYQDTNYAQQAILTLLTIDKQNICVVGDDAQSIYAFRGANIDNILNFQNTYKNARLFKLEQNYRSTQTIVGAANSLISHNVRQIKKISFSENGYGDKIHINIAYSDKEEACIVCRNIESLHLRENVAYGDIAVLYRTNAQSRLFENEMRKMDIPYRIYGGMSFYQHKEIKDVIAYFKLVANPNDEEALKRIINVPKRGIGNTTMDKLILASRTCNVPLWNVIAHPLAYNVKLSPATSKKVVAFYNMIERYVNISDKMDAYTLGKEIFENCGMAIEIASDTSVEGKERKNNIDEFMSGLHDFVDTKQEEGHNSEIYLENFIQEVSLLTDVDKEVADNDESNINRVTLMTVHASKGLEFNSIFIVGMEENIFPSLRSCDYQKNLEEERRLFYVAITRAMERCFISCSKSRYQYGNMCFNEPSRFLKEIDRKWLDVKGGGGLVAPVSRTSHHFHEIKNDAIYHSSLGSEKKTHSIQCGQTIEHQRFGVGKVISVDGYGENEKAIVDFSNVGKKTLLMKFARYTLIAK